MQNKSQDFQFLWQALEKSKYGSLRVNLPDGAVKNFGNNSSNNLPLAEIIIKDFDFINDVICGGDIALGEGYIKGLWSSSDLISLLSFFTLNADILEEFFHNQKFKTFLLFLHGFFRKNNKRGSKKNISAHYDLGNEFYQLWLDESMTYSSAFFDNKNLSLFDAQINKYQNILDKLNAGSILEIGCGWGGFAQMAAQNNHEITCLTISQKQHDFTENRMAKNGLTNLSKIELRDYRDEKGVYDNIVSIEMFEAVGKQYWDKYFEVVASRLKASGKAVLQIITIDEKVFKDYINRVDFIQKHIFPGGVLPAKSKIYELAKKHNLQLVGETAFGLDYATTLEIWLKNFDEKYQEIKNLGFDDEFIRKWRFYLCYCIAGFRAHRCDVVQFELKKL